jgi:hypothetical protein
VKQLKTVVTIAAELITEVAKITQDKKVTFSELLSIAPELMKIPSFVSNLAGAIEELKAGISPEYQKEINEAVKAKIDLANDKVEAVVELVIQWIIITNATALQVAALLKK